MEQLPKKQKWLRIDIQIEYKVKKCSKNSMVEFVLDSRFYSDFSRPYFNGKTLFHSKSYSIFVLIPFYMFFNLSIGKIMVETLCGLLGLFPIQGLFSVFNFSDLLIWIKLQKDVSAPSPLTSATCGFDLCWFIWVFLGDICEIMCVKKSQLSQKEPSKWGFFCIFLGSTFLRLMYFIQYLNTFVKKSFIFFLHLISPFPCNVFLFSFLDSSLTLQEGNETLQTPNWILKQWRVFSKLSLLQSNSAKISQGADNFYWFFLKIVAKSSLIENKICFHQLQLYLWDWRLLDKLVSVFYPFG